MRISIAKHGNGKAKEAKAAKETKAIAGKPKMTYGTRAATRADEIIGQKLRAARLRAAMSQADLAASVGVSFQQIQKYERGTNRIPMPRLADMARTLGTSFEEFTDHLKSKHKRSDLADRFDAFLSTKDGTDLVHAILRIKDPLVRRKIVDIARVLAGDSHVN